MAKKQGKKKQNGRFKHGLFVKIDEASLDGRTWLAKTINDLRRDLADYLGDNTPPPANMLISRVIYKHLRLSFYETSNLANPEHGELQHYVCLSNSLRRDLETLARMAGRKKPLDLDEYLQKRYGSKK